MENMNKPIMTNEIQQVIKDFQKLKASIYQSFKRNQFLTKNLRESE